MDPDAREKLKEVLASFGKLRLSAPIPEHLRRHVAQSVSAEIGAFPAEEEDGVPPSWYERLQKDPSDTSECCALRELYLFHHTATLDCCLLMGLFSSSESTLQNLGPFTRGGPATTRGIWRCHTPLFSKDELYLRNDIVYILIRGGHSFYPVDSVTPNLSPVSISRKSAIKVYKNDVKASQYLHNCLQWHKSTLPIICPAKGLIRWGPLGVYYENLVLEHRTLLGYKPILCDWESWRLMQRQILLRRQRPGELDPRDIPTPDADQENEEGTEQTPYQALCNGSIDKDFSQFLQELYSLLKIQKLPWGLSDITYFCWSVGGMESQVLESGTPTSTDCRLLFLEACALTSKRCPSLLLRNLSELFLPVIAWVRLLAKIGATTEKGITNLFRFYEPQLQQITRTFYQAPVQKPAHIHLPPALTRRVPSALLFRTKETDCPWICTFRQTENIHKHDSFGWTTDLTDIIDAIRTSFHYGWTPPLHEIEQFVNYCKGMGIKSQELMLCLDGLPTLPLFKVTLQRNLAIKAVKKSWDRQVADAFSTLHFTSERFLSVADFGNLAANTMDTLFNNLRKLRAEWIQALRNASEHHEWSPLLEEASEIFFSSYHGTAEVQDLRQRDRDGGAARQHFWQKQKFLHLLQGAFMVSSIIAKTRVSLMKEIFTVDIPQLVHSYIQSSLTYEDDVTGGSVTKKKQQLEEQDNIEAEHHYSRRLASSVIGIFSLMRMRTLAASPCFSKRVSQYSQIAARFFLSRFLRMTPHEDQNGLRTFPAFPTVWLQMDHSITAGLIASLREGLRCRTFPCTTLCRKSFDQETITHDRNYNTQKGNTHGENSHGENTHGENTHGENSHGENRNGEDEKTKTSPYDHDPQLCSAGKIRNVLLDLFSFVCFLPASISGHGNELKWQNLLIAYAYLCLEVNDHESASEILSILLESSDYFDLFRERVTSEYRRDYRNAILKLFISCVKYAAQSKNLDLQEIWASFCHVYDALTRRPLQQQLPPNENVPPRDRALYGGRREIARSSQHKGFSFYAKSPPDWVEAMASLSSPLWTHSGYVGASVGIAILYALMRPNARAPSATVLDSTERRVPESGGAALLTKSTLARTGQLPEWKDREGTELPDRGVCGATWLPDRGVREVAIATGSDLWTTAERERNLQLGCGLLAACSGSCFQTGIPSECHWTTLLATKMRVYCIEDGKAVAPLMNFARLAQRAEYIPSGAYAEILKLYAAAHLLVSYNEAYRLTDLSAIEQDAMVILEMLNSRTPANRYAPITSIPAAGWQASLLMQEAYGGLDLRTISALALTVESLLAVFLQQVHAAEVQTQDASATKTSACVARAESIIFGRSENRPTVDHGRTVVDHGPTVVDHEATFVDSRASRAVLSRLPAWTNQLLRAFQTINVMFDRSRGILPTTAAHIANNAAKRALTNIILGAPTDIQVCARNMKFVCMQHDGVRMQHEGVYMQD